MSNTTTLIDDGPTVIESITTGQYDDCIGSIIKAAQERRTRVAIQLGHQLTIGQRVIYTRGRPRYLIGEKGTVKKVMHSYVLVTLDRPIGKFVGDVRTPMTLIRALDEGK